jgi:hypothetical protein
MRGRHLAGLRRRAAPADPATRAEPAPEDTVAIEGYDRLSDRKVIARLPELAQTELAAVEAYERTHRERAAVLAKLRHLRSDEPLAGYDALTPEEIPKALEGADLAVINNARGYERKLRRRESVLSAIDHVRRQRRRASTQQPPRDHRSVQ